MREKLRGAAKVRPPEAKPVAFSFLAHVRSDLGHPFSVIQNRFEKAVDHSHPVFGMSGLYRL